MENTFFGRLLEVHKVQIAVNMCYLNVQIEQCLFFLSARKKKLSQRFLVSIFTCLSQEFVGYKTDRIRTFKDHKKGVKKWLKVFINNSKEFTYKNM